jgi:hypothetical protein
MFGKKSIGKCILLSISRTELRIYMYVLSNLLRDNIYKCKQSILLINKMGHENFNKKN